jgi:hypothetical protein
MRSGKAMMVYHPPARYRSAFAMASKSFPDLLKTSIILLLRTASLETTLKTRWRRVLLVAMPDILITTTSLTPRQPRISNYSRLQ